MIELRLGQQQMIERLQMEVERLQIFALLRPAYPCNVAPKKPQVTYGESLIGTVIFIESEFALSGQPIV